MSLNVQCLRYVDASFVIAISDELLLCHVVGRSDGRCFSILIKRCLSDDDSDRIVIDQGLWEGFQHYGGYSFPTTVTVGTRIECIRDTIR